VLERSLEEALERGEGYIGVEHLLLAVLRDERGGAAQTLRRMSIDPQEMLSRLSEL
jgi:ATP-dependent Clp protease ATP-binding subunit ClpA